MLLAAVVYLHIWSNGPALPLYLSAEIYIFVPQMQRVSLSKRALGTASPGTFWGLM
jgi:hypothetical protein